MAPSIRIVAATLTHPPAFVKTSVLPIVLIMVLKVCHQFRNITPEPNTWGHGQLNSEYACAKEAIPSC